MPGVHASAIASRRHHQRAGRWGGLGDVSVHVTVEGRGISGTGTPSSSTESGVGLWVRVKGGQPEVDSDVARVAINRDHTPAPHPSAMSLPELARTSGGLTVLADAPFFNGYMIHQPTDGWVWYFSTLANESRPRIRADAAAPWPYRTTR